MMFRRHLPACSDPAPARFTQPPRKPRTHGTARRRTVRTAAGWVLAAALAVPPASAETLLDALADAYLTNPTLEAQRAQLRALDENIAVAVSNWRPTLQGQGSIGQSRVVNSPTAGNPEGSLNISNDRGFSASLNQPVFRGFRNFAQRAQAKAEIAAGRAVLEQVEQQVLLDTTTAFLDVVRDQAVLSLNDNQVQVLRRQLEASQDRFRVGEITRTDVAQSEARLEGAIATRAQASVTLETSRAQYERLVGRYPGTLEPPERTPDLPDSLTAAQDLAAQHNPLVLQARANEEVAEHAIRDAKGALLPSVQLNGNVSRNVGAFGPFSQSTDRFAGSVQFTVPLYAGGVTYSNIRRAKQVRSQRLMQIAEARRQVINNVRVAWEQVTAARFTIEAGASQVAANEIALEGVRQEAAVGSRTTLDVLDAEQELLNSRVTLVRSERDSIVAGFALLSAVGQLNAINLGLDVPVYDPSYNYNQVKWQAIGTGITDGWTPGRTANR